MPRLPEGSHKATRLRRPRRGLEHAVADRRRCAGKGPLGTQGVRWIAPVWRASVIVSLVRAALDLRSQHQYTLRKNRRKLMARRIAYALIPGRQCCWLLARRSVKGCRPLRARKRRSGIARPILLYGSTNQARTTITRAIPGTVVRNAAFTFAKLKPTKMGCANGQAQNERKFSGADALVDWRFFVGVNGGQPFRPRRARSDAGIRCTRRSTGRGRRQRCRASSVSRGSRSPFARGSIARSSASG